MIQPLILQKSQEFKSDFIIGLDENLLNNYLVLNVGLLYFPDGIEMASPQGLTLYWPEIN